MRNNLTSLVLIPYWVAEVIDSNGLQLADCIDYEKIRPLLSVHDMATFIAMQDEDRVLLYGNHGQAERSGGHLFDVWKQHTESWPIDSTYKAPVRVASDDCGKMRALAYDSTYRADIVTRLYGPDVKLERYTAPYKVVHLAQQVVGVVIYPGFFEERVDVALQHQLVRAVLDVFYVYSRDYAEVAVTPLFKRHLELLSAE